MDKRLTVGMRARIRPGSSWEEYTGRDVLLTRRSSQGRFAFMALGKNTTVLEKKNPETTDGECAWIGEDQLEFVNADFETNLGFIDWYQENEDNFCPDCGAWFPEYWSIESKAVCPNEKCPRE